MKDRQYSHWAPNEQAMALDQLFDRLGYMIAVDKGYYGDRDRPEVMTKGEYARKEEQEKAVRERATGERES